jgi:hypothetical protein
MEVGTKIEQRDHVFCCTGQYSLRRIDLLHTVISFKMSGFEVLTVVTKMSIIFLDVTPHSLGEVY